jgi:hypothetical protein
MKKALIIVPPSVTNYFVLAQNFPGSFSCPSFFEQDNKKG